VTAPIIGANSVEQLSESMAVVGLRLDDEEMRALDDLSSWRED
jgi:aryl-alcohol dehydrogenase-like predicted oxidoreductase